LIEVVDEVVKIMIYDAIHFDDYFSLQNKGEEFDDSASFKKFSDGMSLATGDV
jgi:uncharacterized lipoprotein YddW (UPF0748 family)